MDVLGGGVFRRPVLSGADVRALTASTDGWAAGLRLATLFLRGGADASSLLGRLCGANDVIGEFLAENVVDTLEPEMADFILATSITERTCGGLASALSEHPRGLATLEEVAHRGLFLAGRRRSRVVSLSPTVRRIPTPSPCARRSRAESATAPHSGGMVRRTWLPQRGRQPCARGR